MNDYLKEVNKRRSNDLIDSILKQAAELKTPIMTEDGINFLIQLIQVSKSTEVLEIGSAIGYSSIMMSTFTGCNVFTIERKLDTYLLAKANIAKANLDSKIKIVNADALSYELNEDYRCDLLFIDAAKSQYIKFLEKYEKHLNPKGIIVSDNLLFHGFVEHTELIESRNRKQLVRKINKFNEYLVNNNKYDTYIYEIGDGISISIKK